MEPEPQRETGSIVVAYLLLAVTALFWGANAIFARLAVGEVSPMVLVALRWFVVTLVLAATARRQFLEDWPTLRRGAPLLCAMGVLGFTGFNALYYVAAHTTTAINIGILQGILPIAIVIGARVLYGTPIGAARSLAVIAALVGVAVVASAGSLGRLVAIDFVRGDLLILLASLFYAAYTLGLRARPPGSAMSAFALMACAAFVATLPLVIAEWWVGSFALPTPKGWLLIAAIALLPSLLGQLFFIHGVERLGPGRAGVFTNLVPVTASILSVLILGERFRTFHALALVLVMGAIALSEWSSRSAGAPVGAASDA